MEYYNGIDNLLLQLNKERGTEMEVAFYIILTAFNIASCIIYFRRKSLYITFVMCLISFSFMFISLIWTIPFFIFGIKNEKKYKSLLKVANQMEAIEIEKLTKICREKYPAIEKKVSTCQNYVEAMTIIQSFALANNIEVDERCILH